MTRREQFEAWLKDTPDDPELIYSIALEHVSEGAPERGLAILLELNRTQPAYVAAYLQAGQLLVKLGREDEARAVFAAGIDQARKAGNHHAAGEMAGFLDAIG